ncbi:hypothetical protein PHMEG_00016234 [Phytophthora megakarya]|uniref:Uncharacterized protein n=1 Tax=Phytophthora megakarya TaxID=4795 RepID=A0A225W0V7_9STRA|nr:hypothetical protein PHMEG_00016234 [Phytophthora megakarya]
MLNASSPGPESEAVHSPVDLEMFYESIVLQGAKLAAEFGGYVVNTVQCLQHRYTEIEVNENDLLEASSRLWRWLQRNLRRGPDVANVNLVPLPQQTSFPLKLEHMVFIAERFDDIETQLQLIHAVVDDLHEKAHKADTELGLLQEKLKRVPMHHCQSRERYESSTSVPTTTKPPTSKLSVSEHRLSTPALQVGRLEVPM